MLKAWGDGICSESSLFSSDCSPASLACQAAFTSLSPGFSLGTWVQVDNHSFIYIFCILFCLFIGYLNSNQRFRNVHNLWVTWGLALGNANTSHEIFTTFTIIHTKLFHSTDFVFQNTTVSSDQKLIYVSFKCFMAFLPLGPQVESYSLMFSCW